MMPVYKAAYSSIIEHKNILNQIFKKQISNKANNTVVIRERGPSLVNFKRLHHLLLLLKEQSEQHKENMCSLILPVLSL